MSRDIATHIADDGVATLTLSRPERRNALSIKLRDEITEQLDGWATDPAVRAVVLTGAGSTFCAGFDLREVRKSRSRAKHQGQLAPLPPRCMAIPKAASGRRERPRGGRRHGP